MPTILSMSVTPTVVACNTIIEVHVKAAFDSAQGGTINVAFSAASQCVFEPVPVLSATVQGMYRSKTFRSSFSCKTSGNPQIVAQVIDASSGNMDGSARFITTHNCP